MSLSDCLTSEVLGKIGIVTISFPIDDIINFEINLSFLIEPFSFMTKSQKKNVNILRT